MIIGNNNFSNNNFVNKFKNYKVDNNKRSFIKKNEEQKYTNPTSNNDMNDKALAMLQERLNNNLITLEEFNKKCIEIGKRRKN